MKISNIRVALVVACFAFHTKAQTILINSPGYGTANPINCSNFNDGEVVNFFDSGGAGGNYSPNENLSITICPNLPNGPKIIASFGINTGFTWNVAGDDFLTIYDGPTTDAPILGSFNSVSHPNGFSVAASFENNPSGCLTFVFVSNASNQGTGWGANISCGNPPQPFIPRIQAFVNGSSVNALNPADTGYVDVCYGDTILFVSNPDFPYSFEANGFGYSQSNASVDFEWSSSTGQVGTGNQFMFIPPTRDGFLITLLVTDLFPQTMPLICKVRVSQIPSFAGAGPLKDTACVNEQIPLLGGANQADTVGVTFPGGTFVIGGTFGGLLPLPDGSGIAYSTSINMTNFGENATFSNPSDLVSMCVNMEHSYLGDLEMWLACPNGQTTLIFNSFTGAGPYPGGFGGGGTFLGDANDQGNGTPGIGFDYCFSTIAATWGTMGQEHAANNTVPVNSFAPPAGNAMNPNGVYLPEESFGNFIGCPLNGEWTLFIQDNLSVDDGYVFNWSLNFNSSLFPNTESYQNSLVNHYWEDHPTIVVNQDTMIVVSSNVTGTYNYTFVVEDNFGCIYDTTVSLFVKPGIVLNIPTQICHDTLYLTENEGFSDGVWSAINSPGQPEFVTPNNINPMVVFPSAGVYTLVYSDLTCPDGDTATVELIAFPYAQVGSDTMCIGQSFTIQVVGFDAGNTIVWNTGETTPNLTVNQGGVYTATISNVCGSFSQDAVITEILCDFDVPNVFSPNGDGANDNFQLILAEGLQAFNIAIVNRWGQIIREFNDPNFQWNGTDENGANVTEGVYFYKAIGTIFGGEEIMKHGFVHLVRE